MWFMSNEIHVSIAVTPEDKVHVSSSVSEDVWTRPDRGCKYPRACQWTYTSRNHLHEFTLQFILTAVYFSVDILTLKVARVSDYITNSVEW